MKKKALQLKMLNNLPTEEFLNGKVRIIFEPMISKILLEKPEDPVYKFYL